MHEFLLALIDPNFPFLRIALVAGILAAPAFGVIGTYVVVNRISSMAGAVSHSVLAGIGLAVFLRSRDPATWFTPTLGALLAAVLSALCISRIGYRARSHLESTVNVVWALGASIGVLFLAFSQGYSDPSGYLFGTILVLSPAHLIVLAVLVVVVLAVGLGLYPQWASVSADAEFARCRGINVARIREIMLVTVGVAVVLLVDVVGVVLVIAMFSLPPSLASLAFRTLKGWMVGASLISAFSIIGGLVLAYLADLPSGASIVGVAALAYAAGHGADRVRYTIMRRKTI